ncbi:MAG: DNA repair protein RadC [Patescibacteria group bacterium]
MKIPPKDKYFMLDQNFIIDAGDKEYVLMIRDLDDKDKPREKLLEYGPTALSSAELLAVVLNVGTKKEDVLQMSDRILKEYGDRTIMHNKNPRSLANELNIPLYKACQIVACFELGHRYFKDNQRGKVVIRTAKQAFNYLKDMRQLPKEQLRGLYLNSRYQLIHDEVISVGSLTANIIHPREVFRPAIEYAAAAVIIAHNHPSGSVKSSKSDLEITTQLKAAGQILGIDLLDHLIIAGNRFGRVEN